MNIKRQMYLYKKRIKDDDLLEIQKMVSEEIERRQLNDKNNSYKGA